MIKKLIIKLIIKLMQKFNFKVKTTVEVDGKVISTEEQTIPVKVETETNVDQEQIDPEVPVDPEVPTEPEIPILPEGYITLEEIGGDINEAFSKALQMEGKILKLLDGKTYSITKLEPTEPKLKAIIGNPDPSKRPNLEMGNWAEGFTSTPFVFSTNGKDVEFSIVNVNVMYPAGHLKRTAIQNGALFTTKPNTIKSAKLALIGSHTPEDRLSWGVAGFTYSPNSEDENDFVDIIAQDFTHKGPGVIQSKINGNNRVRIVFEDFIIHNPQSKDAFDGRSSIYNPTYFKFTGNVSGGKVTLKEGDFNLAKTHHGFEAIGVRTVMQIGRFVFNVYDDSVSTDGKTFTFIPVKKGDKITFTKETNVETKLPEKTIVTDAELQPGDITTYGTVIEKQIQNRAFEDGNDRWPRWAYSLDTNQEIPKSGELEVLESTFNLTGEQPVMIAYKYNSGFSDPRVTVNTEFGSDVVRQTGGIGWTMYPEREVELFWKNGTISGFVRFSSDSVIKETRGYNIENVEFLDGLGEFQYREPFKDFVLLPVEIVEYKFKIKNY